MKKIPVYFRALLLLSGIWLLLVMVNAHNPDRMRAFFPTVMLIGVLPIVIVLGIAWIVQGIKNKKK